MSWDEAAKRTLENAVSNSEEGTEERTAAEAALAHLEDKEAASLLDAVLCENCGR